MTWIPVVLATAILAVLATALYGAHVVFHPPKMLKMETWPEQYGLPYEKTSFRTSDGVELSGWLIPAAESSNRTVVLCHGWGDNKGDLLRRAWFLQRCFNLFLFDFRHHGESAGRFTTICCLESRDVEAAMDHLARARPEWTERLGIFGISMGASLAIWAATSRGGVKAVALESPFASFNDVVAQWVYNSCRLPRYPFAWTTLAVIRRRIGEDPEPYSPIYHAAKLAPRPALFIAGSEDRLMPPAVVQAVYEKAGEPKELWIIEGAGHGKCGETAGPEYRRRLTEFFGKNL